MAIFASGLVVATNILMRPLVRLLNKQPIESAEIETSYVVTVKCRNADEAEIRALLVRGFSTSDLHLRELESNDIDGSDKVEINATLVSDKRRELALEYIVGQLSTAPGVSMARWRTVNTLV